MLGEMMKLKVNDEEICELKPWQLQVLADSLIEEEVEADMIRRVKYAWEHKFERCYERLVTHWLPILHADPSISSMPASQEELAKFILNLPQYKNRTQRDAEEG